MNGRTTPGGQSRHPPVRSRLSTSSPDYQMVVTDDGSRTLYSVSDQETFHSESGARAESQHVFLKTSGLLAPLERSKTSTESPGSATLPTRSISPTAQSARSHAPQSRDQCRREETGVRSTKVLEIGFGTGLNFLLAADAAVRHKQPLNYTAIEQRMLPVELLAELQYGQFVEFRTLYDQWLNWTAGIQAASDQDATPDAAVYRFEYGDYVRLELHVADAIQVDLSLLPVCRIVFLDAFSPRANPELWSESFLRRLVAQLHPGGRLVTYCVKSEVQRRLANLGLAVRTVPGPPGGKRQVLLAEKKNR